MGQRRKFNSSFKSKVALDAVRGEKTLNELARKYQIHPNQITQWKKRLLEGAGSLFDSPASQQTSSQEREDQLYQKIGQLQVELDWLKKSLNRSHEEKRSKVEPDHPQISVER